MLVCWGGPIGDPISETDEQDLHAASFCKPPVSIERGSWL